MNRLVLALTSSLIGLSLAAPASAQTINSGQSAAASTNDAGGEEEIVVTAQKREEQASDVPAAVTALSVSQLQDAHVSSQRDLVGQVPSLQVSGALGSGSFVLRGLNSGVESSPLVGMQIDGAPIGSVTSGGGGAFVLPQVDVSTLSRIEVLRGPQGTLYGGSTLGGIVNYVTSSPSLNDARGSAFASYSGTDGGDDNYVARLMYGAPIIEDVLSFQLSGFVDRSSGFIDAPNATGDDYDFSHANGGRAALRWQVTPDFTVQVSGLYSSLRSFNSEVIANPATSEPVGPDLTYSQVVLPRYDNDFSVGLVNADYDLGWGSLSYILSVQHSDTQWNSDNSLGLLGGIIPGLEGFGGQAIPPGAPIGVITNSEFNKTTHELRLASPGEGRLQWLAGLFYSDEDSRSLQDIAVVQPDQNPAPGALGSLLRFEQPTTLREIAGFANVTYSITPELDVTGGIRYSDVEQDFRRYFGGSDAAAYNVLFGLFGFDPTPADTGLASSSETATTYMANVRYHISADTMAYFRYSTGYRPGGPNSAALGLPSTFDADTTQNYEVGLKTDFWGNRGYLEFAAFDVEWDDIQVITQSSGGIAGTVNGGQAHSRGAEVSLRLRPIDGLSIDASATYASTAFDENIVTGVGVIALEGDRLPNSPTWSGALGAEYNWSLGGDWRAFAGGQARYNGARDSVPEHSSVFPAYELPEYTVVDVRAGLELNDVEFTLFVNNLTDERAQTGSISQGVPYVVLQRPTTIGASLRLQY